MKKVVLAFSGGLDTTYCAIYLSKIKNLEVHTVLVNTGGFSSEEINDIEQTAVDLGVKSHKTIDRTSDFYRKCVKYLLFGNILRNHTYPLSVSAERTFQALAVADHVNEIKADYVAHGSTGAGNDQVRFDLVFQVNCPDAGILTPIRDLKLSRKEEVEFLKKYGFEKNWEKAKYSINKGLWGTSVGGAETLTSNEYLPEEAFPSGKPLNDTGRITIGFKKGEPVTLEGEKLPPVDLIKKLNIIGSKYGIGRDIHVGDTIIGIKGRVGFEAAAPLILIKAHQLLEKHVLSKWQLYWKDQLSTWYGMQVHEGQYIDPVLRNMEKFLEDSQDRVTGEVYITLNPYRFLLEGIESKFDLMQTVMGEYGEMNNAWSGDDVKSFTKISGNALQIFHSKQES